MFAEKVEKYLHSTLSVMAIAGFVEVLVGRGFLLETPSFFPTAINMFYSFSIIFFFAWVSIKLVNSGWNFRLLSFDIALSVVLISMVFPVRISGPLVTLRMMFSLFLSFLRKTGISSFFSQYHLNPARLLIMTFVGVIAAGTAALMLPAATSDQMGADLIDALFTSTSATCVTGLIVKDTPSYFSGFGQFIILLLIQIGGLGIMTFSTLFALIVGKKLGLKQEEQMKDMLDQSSPNDMYRLIIQIIRITLIFELTGALLLFFKWSFVMDPASALKNGVFHSISAFCNAGFSLFPANLMDYVDDFSVSMIISVLIIFGGLGFVVISDVFSGIKNYNPFTLRWSRLSVHSRIVIITTGWLILAGTLAFFFIEFDNTLLNLTLRHKILASFFQSVTFRTAGFNTVDFGLVKDATLFIGMILMFIGASPASTGGGIKTTTFAVLLLAVRSLLYSRDRVEIFRRTIPHQIVYKSIAITLFSAFFLTVFITLLLLTQKDSFVNLAFEAFSAIGTVGVSAGSTWRLDSIGKTIIIILMFLGRVGPLTIALALGEVRKLNVEYPETRINVG